MCVTPAGLLQLVLTLHALVHHSQGLCPSPAVELNSRVSLSSEELTENTVAKYTCDPGFIQIGESSRLCTAEDTWTGKPPSCVTNVAEGKPSSQSSTARGGPASNGNNGETSSLHDGTRCTESRNQTSPWWRVDLLRTYPIQMIRLVPRGCCGLPPLQDVEIRVGQSEQLQQNRLCAWHPGALPEGQQKDFECARPLTGRYVYVQMVGVQGVLSVCEVQVFTAKEFAREQCAPDVALEELSLYNKVCYQLELTKGSNYDQARQSCQRGGGDLAHTLPDAAFQFLTGQLERRRPSMSTQLLWIGIRKTPGQQAWSWVDGEQVQTPRWGRDQPNSYVGEQNCVVLDGSRDWLWNDFSCGIGYLHWICEYRPQSCGSPDRRENTTMVGDSRKVERSVEYRCAEGAQLVGDSKRTCMKDGSWTGAPPTCKHVDCGPLEAPENGELSMLDGRTTYGARARYQCKPEHALLGEPLVTCGDGDKWSGDRPRCLYSLCPKLEPSSGVTMQLSGNLSAGSEALFSCPPGHRLLGEVSAQCQLGGTWSSPPPLCQLVDCGVPEPAANASWDLPGGTLYGASVNYSCHDNFLMEGEPERICQADGEWSGATPVCSLIDCGNPEVPDDYYVTGYDFKVGSAVQYHCNDGFVREGDPMRVCQRNGTWSGQPPLCEYVNCGRTFPPIHGDVQYVTDETHFGAQLEYSCARTYRLEGQEVRTCGADGQWSGEAPTCAEVRCNPPERPLHTVISTTGNDAMRQKAKFIRYNLAYRETFRVDSTATYKCKPGYKVVGDAQRRCETTGGWSGLPPACVYVNCGQPEPLPRGSVSLAGGVTHYQAVAEYKCEPGFRPRGDERRLCGEDGTWSGKVPTCVEVSCDEPGVNSPLETVSRSGLSVGDTARYSCGTGRRLVGDQLRTCQTSGEWSGTPPSCKWVDCGPLPAVENGRTYLVNQSTLYDSLGEHNCFPGYVRRGPFTRRCTETGDWSQPNTTCVEEGGPTPVKSASPIGAPPGEAGDLTEVEEVMGQVSDEEAERITTGWVSGAVVVFLLMVAGAVFFNWRSRHTAAKTNGNSHSLKRLPGSAPTAAPIYSEPADAPQQTRPLPTTPGHEEEIYASMDDSFSSGAPTPPPSVYANRDATYANGLQHSPGADSAIYVNGDTDATYANDEAAAGGTPSPRGLQNGGFQSDAAVASVNGLRPGAVSPDSGYRAPVSVNGVLM